jgi:hypothetical protein
MCLFFSSRINFKNFYIFFKLIFFILYIDIKNKFLKNILFWSISKQKNTLKSFFFNFPFKLKLELEK